MREEYRDRYELRYPIYMPDWDTLDPNFDILTMSPWTELLEYISSKPGGLSPKEALTSEGFMSFLESKPPSHNFDGFASVLPAYDDTPLKRDPRVIPRIPVQPRNDGETLRKNFAGAVATGAEHIIVYGWNEYFEGSTIEPTQGYGMQYVDICRELIRSARAVPGD